MNYAEYIKILPVDQQKIISFIRNYGSAEGYYYQAKSRRRIPIKLIPVDEFILFNILSNNKRLFRNQLVVDSGDSDYIYGGSIEYRLGDVLYLKPQHSDDDPVYIFNQKNWSNNTEITKFLFSEKDLIDYLEKNPNLTLADYRVYEISKRIIPKIQIEVNTSFGD